MTEPNTLLRIDRLSLRNFRCFAECSLELHPRLTVLAADNAGGKTALLDALRLALNVFDTTMSRSKQGRGFEDTDVRLVRDAEGRMKEQLPTQFMAEGFIADERVSWARALGNTGPHARSSIKDTKAIRAAALRLADKPDVREHTKIDSPTILPIIAYYGTGRLWDGSRQKEGPRWLAPSNPARTSAYIDGLSPSSSSYSSFVTLYEETAEAIRDPRFKVVGREERPETHLAAVRDAVCSILDPTGWTAIDWVFAPKDAAGHSQGRGYVVVEHTENGRLPLSQLSDGVRNMVSLIADLAYRCVRLNPHLGEEAARLTPGILLIDEIDMHLHPRWQQLVVDLLQKTFPAMQMILTTHSPQVLSSVNMESIRMINVVNGEGTTKTPEFQTRGVESSDVLANIMGVNQVPQVEESKWLNDYRALIETGNQANPDGLALRSKLVGHFGSSHPLILDCDRLIRFQDFKRRKPQAGQE